MEGGRREKGQVSTLQFAGLITEGAAGVTRVRSGISERKRQSREMEDPYSRDAFEYGGRSRRDSASRRQQEADQEYRASLGQRISTRKKVAPTKLGDADSYDEDEYLEEFNPRQGKKPRREDDPAYAGSGRPGGRPPPGQPPGRYPPPPPTAGGRPAGRRRAGAPAALARARRRVEDTGCDVEPRGGRGAAEGDQRVRHAQLGAAGRHDGVAGVQPRRPPPLGARVLRAVRPRAAAARRGRARARHPHAHRVGRAHAARPRGARLARVGPGCHPPQGPAARAEDDGGRRRRRRPPRARDAARQRDALRGASVRGDGAGAAVRPDLAPSRRLPQL